MDSMQQQRLDDLREHILPFNEQHADRLSFESCDVKPHASIQYNRSKRPTYFLSCLLAIGYIPMIGLCFLFYRRSLENQEGLPPRFDLFPSLAKSQAVKYETRVLEVKLHGNKFAGDPRPELDAAWHELFEGIRIRVAREDLQYYNLTSLQLADGSGYAAELGVHHELHCLKKIRHWIYKDYYLVNETETEFLEWKSHINHCLELMRESIMCRGDSSLSTFKWLPGRPPTLTAVAEGHHHCVNWGSLLDWVRKRSVPIFDDNVLERPDSM